MINLDDVQSKLQDDLDAATDWCNSIYEEQFAVFFKDTKKLFRRLQSRTKPITDDELSEILIDIPLRMYDAAENLNKFRLSYEVIKMRIKQKKSEVIKSSTETTLTRKQEEAANAVLEDELLKFAYDSIITRVENENSFTRELIMGAKKIWDARRYTEQINPVCEVDNTPNIPKLPTYVKGV